MKYKTFITYSLKLFKVEIFLFSFFILVAILFNIDTNAHKYFNESDIIYSFHGFFALLATFCFAIFFWVSICFPILLLVQLIVLIREKYFKQYWKLFLLITILYLCSLVAWFSLHSINQRNSFLERREQSQHKVSTIEHYNLLFFEK